MAKPLYKNLTVQVLVGVVIGVTIGYLKPEWGTAIKPLGDSFIRLIKMVVAPIVFLTVVCGIASMGDLKKAGRVGVKAIIYFEVITTVALALGLVVANVVEPGIVNGHGIATEPAEPPPETDESLFALILKIVLHTIPENAVGAFAEGDMLQVLFFSVMFGAAMSGLGLRQSPLMHALEHLTEIMFRIVGIIMKVAPLGAMGAIAGTTAKFGIESLLPLLKLLGYCYLTMAIFVFFVLGLVCAWYGFSLWRFLRFIREEILLVLGTSSSESALPRMIEKLELMGCGREVVKLVIPTGYSFNLDGTSIYLSMAVIFIAQAYGVTMSIGQQLYIMLILMLTSKGAAAVTGGGFIVLQSTLKATPVLPLEGLSLLLGVDPFLTRGRALTNLIGNGVATVVVSKMENDFDQARYEAAMSGHALDVPPPGGFSPEVLGDIAADPQSVDPAMGEPRV